VGGDNNVVSDNKKPREFRTRVAMKSFLKKEIIGSVVMRSYIALKLCVREIKQ
jgi:hypothetical protein